MSASNLVEPTLEAWLFASGDGVCADSFEAAFGSAFTYARPMTDGRLRGAELGCDATLMLAIDTNVLIVACIDDDASQARLARDVCSRGTSFRFATVLEAVCVRTGGDGIAATPRADRCSSVLDGEVITMPHRGRPSVTFWPKSGASTSPRLTVHQAKTAAFGETSSRSSRLEQIHA